jgi:acyl-CoA hydrolase
MTDASAVPQDPLPPSASECTLTRIMTAVDANLHGNIHGGVIMKMVDDAAGVVAARHSGGLAVTVSMDEMVFHVPVHIGELLNVRARINWAGTTSMEIGVRVEAERWDGVGPPMHTSTAYVVYVALDAGERPRPVRPVAIETEIDRRRFREAQIRREHRLARRDAILESRKV